MIKADHLVCPRRVGSEVVGEAKGTVRPGEIFCGAVSCQALLDKDSRRESGSDEGSEAHSGR